MYTRHRPSIIAGIGSLVPSLSLSHNPILDTSLGDTSPSVDVLVLRCATILYRHQTCTLFYYY